MEFRNLHISLWGPDYPFTHNLVPSRTKKGIIATARSPAGARMSESVLSNSLRAILDASAVAIFRFTIIPKVYMCGLSDIVSFARNPREISIGFSRSDIWRLPFRETRTTAAPAPLPAVVHIRGVVGARRGLTVWVNVCTVCRLASVEMSKWACRQCILTFNPHATTIPMYQKIYPC